MSLGTIWVVAAALLLALEMTTGEFTLASLAIGCALAAGLAGLGFGLPVQAGAAAVVSLLATAVLAPWLRRTLAPAPTPDPVQALVGEEAEVLEAVLPGSAGKVKLNGVVWQATSDTFLPPGTRVLVMEVDGARLRVLPADPNGSATASPERGQQTSRRADTDAVEHPLTRGLEEPPTLL
jgi:membrane protein implicated in regulation of membrane protease activity